MIQAVSNQGSLSTVFLLKSSIKAKQLAALIAQYLVSQEKLQNEKLDKLANDTKLELSDVKACVALVEFVLVNAAKYNVNGETLSSELQQLGLPKGNMLA